MPMAGLGTWQYNSSVAETATLAALNMGYVHIDTALGYLNQDGIARAIKSSGRKRSSFFITSKVPGGLSEKDATSNLTLAVSQLGLDYVDLMLVHFPATWGGKGGKPMRQATWRAMEAFVKAGKARAIGVSHYCKSHVEDILEIATIKPAVNQVQYHVGMGPLNPAGSGDNATDYKDYMTSVGITYQGFSPLCGPCSPSDHAELITGDLVTSIGKKYGKTGAQVSLKWQVQSGIPVIPKTTNPEYMAQNIDLFDWVLSDVYAAPRRPNPLASATADCALLPAAATCTPWTVPRHPSWPATRRARATARFLESNAFARNCDPCAVCLNERAIANDTTILKGSVFVYTRLGTQDAQRMNWHPLTRPRA